MGLFDSLAGGLGDTTNMISSFLHPEKGYEKGQDQLNKYYNQATQYYTDAQGNLKPYNQFGQDVHGDYLGAMKRLLDPAALESDWMKGYAESESAKNAERMAQEHGLDAASGLGLMGSNTALNAIQGGTSQIGLNDRQNYLDNLMQKYLAGANIAGNIYGTGAGAAGQMGENAMNMGRGAMGMGEDSAKMAYGQENAPGALFGKMLGTVASIMGGRGGGGGAGAGGGSSWSLGGG